MSTRCVINFNEGTEVIAKIYRHHDGYPDTDEGVLADLQKFFEAVENDTQDTRFNDPSYLAAKFVVWHADQNLRPYRPATTKALAFTGVGILIENPGDIAYEYFVNCGKRDGNGRPVITHQEVR